MGLNPNPNQPPRLPFGEEDLLPISALQHLAFCARQCALIHLEQSWAENSLTAEGRILHERPDSGRPETRDGVRTARSLHIRSLKLGLAGIADVVEFHPVTVPGDSPLARRAFPVEYKRGKPKSDDCDQVQLCAQAICLEEMLGSSIPHGALFYGTTRRRLDVNFDTRLRARTVQLAAELHSLIRSGRTPPPVYTAKCDACSLINLCLPKATASNKHVSAYLTAALAQSLGERADDMRRDN